MRDPVLSSSFSTNPPSRPCIRSILEGLGAEGSTEARGTDEEAHHVRPTGTYDRGPIPQPLPVVGGGAAYAASHLKKNSVTSQTIKNGQVKTADLAAGAVTNPKLANGAVSSTTVLNNSLGTNDLADGSVTAAKLAAGAVSSASIPPNSLTGADINESTLVGTKAGNVYSVMFDTSKGCCETQIARASDPGIKSDGGGAPACRVIFPRDVSNCSYTASSTNASDTSLSATSAYAETALLPGDHTEEMWRCSTNLERPSSTISR
jgi:hypothetical protein